MSKNFSVKFYDIIEAESEEQVYVYLLDYLENCLRNEDVEAFEIKEVN